MTGALRRAFLMPGRSGGREGPSLCIPSLVHHDALSGGEVRRTDRDCMVTLP